MTEDNKKRIETFCNYVATNYRESQILLVYEELGELISAINKYRRKKITFEDFISEIADVEIMLHQLKKLYKVDQDQIDDIKVQKIERAIKAYNLTI